MSEFYDDLIGDALGDFRAAEAAAADRTPGADAVRATIKRRRTVRLATLSVLGVLLITTPIAAFAANPHGDNAPPTPGESHTPGPPETVSPGPSTSPSASTAHGKIPLEQLSSAAVDIPPFVTDTCQVKQVRLATEPRPEQQPWVAKVVYTNLDDDPAQETAALLLCQVGEVPESQVVAFDRDPSGKIVSVGQIVGQGYKLNIRDISARAQGGITADVSDLIACCDTPKSQEQHQQRDYAWDGAKFSQVGGPTVFGNRAYVTDLQVLVTDATLGPAIAGKRSATVTVTVKNNGPKPSGRFQVGFGDCTFSCAGGIPYWAWGDHETYHGPLAAGRSTSTTINLNFDANTPGGDIRARLIVIGIENDKEITDLNPANNTAVFHVRLG